MRNILIFVTGIGWGDAVREYAIINELRKKAKVKVMIAAYDMSKKFFEGKFPTTEIKGFNATSEKFNLEFSRFLKSNATLPLTWASQVKKLREETKKFRPDLVITDFEPLGVMFARKSGIKFVEVFGVEPKGFKEFLAQKKRFFFHKMQANFLSDMYDAGNKFGEAIIVPSIQKSDNFGKFNFVNLIVRDNKVKTSSSIKTRDKVVIILGGSTFGVALGKILMRVLNKIDEEFVIFGIGDQHQKIKNVELIPLREDAIEYIKNSSGVITLAGHSTISEALVFKKPLLSFPIPNHIEQAYNAYILKKNGLAIVKEIGEKFKEGELENGIKEFLKMRGELKNNIRRAKIKGNGAVQAAKIISGIS